MTEQGRILDRKDSNKSTNKGSESTGEMANVLSSIGAANILASGGLKKVFTTASLLVPPVSLFVPTLLAISLVEMDSMLLLSLQTTAAKTPNTRRTGEIKELEEEFAQDYKRTREQIARDIEIARLHTEGELKIMIDELDRSNKVIAKHSKEYAQAEDVLSLKDKIELITELAKYQKDLAQIKIYQAQQNKRLQGHDIEQIEETFIPIWESIQDFVPMDSKLENERFKRSGTLLEKERAKSMKIVEGSEQQSEGNKDIFRVGQAPKAYPYFEAMLKEFNRDDMVTLWKLVKDRFKEELQKSDLEKCLFWPLKVMFEPVATDGLIGSLKHTFKSGSCKSCRIHWLDMEGLIIYMLMMLGIHFQKTTLPEVA
ncbi:hypothetical protein Tco_1203100 [Tanacetum coccineum]